MDSEWKSNHSRTRLLKTCLLHIYFYLWLNRGHTPEFVILSALTLFSPQFSLSPYQLCVIISISDVPTLFQFNSCVPAKTILIFLSFGGISSSFSYFFSFFFLSKSCLEFIQTFWKSDIHLWYFVSINSIPFSCSVQSDSLRPHEPQHTRPPCPSPTPGVYPNSCPLSQWCHPTISSSVVSFSSHLQSFLTSGSFQMSQLFTSGDQNIGVSASASVLPVNTQDWFPLGWTGSPCSPRDSQESSTHFKSISSSVLSFLYSPTLISIHDHWKNHNLD